MERIIDVAQYIFDEYKRLSGKVIDETVENLKHLNKESLLIVKGGTEMLKARDAMSAEQEQKTKQEAMK